MEILRQLMIILAVLLGWWAVCLGADVLIYSRLPRTYLPRIKRKVKFLTYGFPVFTVILIGLVTQNLTWGLVALSPVVLALAFDFADSLAWAMVEMEPGRLN